MPERAQMCLGEQQREGRLAWDKVGTGAVSSLWDFPSAWQRRTEHLLTAIRFNQESSDTEQINSDKAGLRSSQHVKSMC